MALVGPDETVMPGELLRSTKEFYRRLMGVDPELHEMSASASREMDGPTLELEAFVVLWYEVFVSNLIISLRPEVRSNKMLAIRERRSQSGLLDADAERRIRNFQLPQRMPSRRSGTKCS